MTKAGIVAVVGKPNVGKSTLLNRLIGQKLSIMSDKPQSTRDRVVGIRTAGDSQMIISDTPGLLDPQYALQEAMRGVALAAIRDADIIVYLNDARDGIPVPLEAAAGLDVTLSIPVVTVLNKSDLLSEEAQHELQAAVAGSVLTSALTGDGFQVLLETIERQLPEGPWLYPEEDISTQSMRFFAAELIRETALEQLSQEVPYSIACEIEEFRETGSPIYIGATIYVERESQKRILIGDKGRRIREIGMSARKKIEGLVGGKVYLDLWVKVLQNWRRDAAALRRFGYHLPPQSS